MRQSEIQEIKERLKLSEYIAKSIPIKRAGREYHACCPFHHEKTPSFTINDEKGFYHCFGCGKHGDILTYAMEHGRMSYPDAARYLAGIAGVTLTEQTAQDKAASTKAEGYHRIVKLVAQMYEDHLSSASDDSIKSVLAYLERRFGSRARAADAQIRFGLGYAPRSQDKQWLHNRLLQRGISVDDQLILGLITKADDGVISDKFRDRLMFPIKDRRGRVVAFGGRRMDDSPENKAPKYLNSPETPIFRKGSILYHADVALYASQGAAGRLIVCEGYMDVISMAMAGFEYCVAPLGTAVTDRQIMALWHIADAPLFIMDGDAAGRRSMLRAIDTALPHLKAGKTLRFAMLPDGQDPDTIIQQGGASKMEEIFKTRISLSDMLFKTYYLDADRSSPEHKQKAKEDLMTRASSIQDAALRKTYFEHLEQRIKDADKPKTSSPARRDHRSVPAPLMAREQYDTLRYIIAVLYLCPWSHVYGDVESIAASLQAHPDSKVDMARHKVIASIFEESAYTIDAGIERALVKDMPYTVSVSLATLQRRQELDAIVSTLRHLHTTMTKTSSTATVRS